MKSDGGARFSVVRAFMEQFAGVSVMDIVSCIPESAIEVTN